METAENKETKGLDKKKIAIIAGAAVIVVAAVVLVIVNMVKPKETAKSTSMRLLRIIGEVSLLDDGETRTILEDMRLADGNVVTTGEKSLASIGLDDFKIINLEENSKAEFHQDGKKLELTLIEGRLFFDIRKALDETESLDIKASNMIVGILGTSGYVVADKDNPNTQHLYITDGHVKVTITDAETGEAREVEVEYGQKLTIERDENGNVTDIKVEPAPPEQWPSELAAEAASYEETFERILEATGFDRDVIMEVASGDSTISYILELREVDGATPEATPDPTEEPTPEPTEPPAIMIKEVEADGDGTVPPPADGNGNGNGNGQLGAGDGTTNEVTPTPSPVAPVEENPPTEDNSGDSGSGGSSGGSTPTPTAEPTTETVSPSAGAPSPSPSAAGPSPSTEAPSPSPTPEVYTLSSSATTISIADGGGTPHNMNFIKGAYVEYYFSGMTVERTSDRKLKVVLTPYSGSSSSSFESQPGIYYNVSDTNTPGDAPTSEVSLQGDGTYVGYFDEGTIWGYYPYEDYTLYIGVVVPN